MKLTLRKLNETPLRQGPLLLVIMDGLGIGKGDEGDCVFKARKPTLDSLFEWNTAMHLYCQLKAHGTSVGLPSDEDMGNSEVGHNALGAGRVFSQGAKLVNEAIANRSLFSTPVWKKLSAVKGNNSVHLFGLLSDGNVHSHITQLYGLLGELAVTVKKVRIHPLLDGRDVPPKSALEYIRPLEAKLAALNSQHKVDFRIASGGGRMHVTMDRYESDWNTVKRGWDAHVRGIPEILPNYPGFFKTAEAAILAGYATDPKVNDQTLPSFVIVNDAGKPVGPIIDGDSVINFNFRGDRAIQISKAFEYKDFNKFDRVVHPKVEYAGLLQYDGDLKLPAQYLVQPPHIDQTISQYLCAAGVTQFACAETHKYGHVTYFWNGNNSGYINEKLEKYVEIPSEPSEMIAAHPVMKAKEVCDAVITAVKSNKYRFVRVNFANPDMVGHTGKWDSVVTAVETVDTQIGRLKEVITAMNGLMIVIADHGNAEDKSKKYATSHTLNPVPFYLWDSNFNNEYKLATVNTPQLANIAATILNFLDFQAPDNYYPSLISFNK